MGLDVYLYSKEEEEKTNLRSEAWDALWKKKESGQISEAEYEEMREQLPDWASPEDPPSHKYPDHLFNRRYLRSSYNDGGFDRAVPEFLGDEDADLYWVFAPIKSEDEYSIKLTPQSVEELRECKQRALDLAHRLRDAGTPLRAWTIPAYNGFSGPEVTTSDQALEWYREQAARENRMGGSWSNKQGTFVGQPGEGLEALAFVCGKDVLGTPCVHVIFAADDETVEHYAQSAEITAEFCDEAIELVGRDGAAFIHWSS